MWKRKKTKEKDQDDAESPAPDAHDAPTMPAARPLDDDATVWQGQSTQAASVEQPATESEEADAPHPAEADAPTVAIHPSYERKLPDAPSVQNNDSHAVAPTDDSDETVQVRRRPPEDVTEAPATPTSPTEDADSDDAPEEALDPTIPMGRRRG